MKWTATRLVSVFLLVGLVAVSVACGGSDTSNNTNNNANTEPKFKDLGYSDKLTFMGTKVFDTFKDMFIAHDKARYTDNWSCVTCHGKDGTANKYKMPGGGLFPMDPNNPIAEDDATYGAAVKFMKEKVLPEMKKLLQDDTLTCFTCHSKKE
ncbi:MAG: hypothetical protein EP343_07770 [Deltaproteobacteria bacterium]|nr:MAG: hypothetical protein EP343_07770 [Deltaproteobacteria bacterium]